MYKRKPKQKCINCSNTFHNKSGHKFRCNKCQKAYFIVYHTSYSQKHPIDKNKACLYAKRWREKHPQRSKEVLKNYRERNKKLCIKRTVASNRSYRQKARNIVLEHYKPICNCCGEKEKIFLTIDHINGNGNKHRKIVNNVSGGIAGWIIRNDFPKGFQILCMNCNFGKFKNGGTCPHKKI